jgi:glycosyltransferase involved in cell wall biosynthesis
MRIVFFTPGDRMRPSSRTRAHLVADQLRESGYDASSFHIVTRPWWDLSRARFAEFIRNARVLFSLRSSDVLYLHKATEQLDFLLLVFIRTFMLRRGYVFDFDDAIFLPTWRRHIKTRFLVQYADAVIVGSHYLQEYALKYNANSHVLSAPIDTEEIYTAAVQRSNDEPVRIGWTGTPGHYDNMKLLLAPLRRLAEEGAGIVFVQLGGGEKIYELMRSVPGLAVEYTASLPWDKPKEVVAYLQQFDIGVMPLQKTEVNRGKDAWKAKEYMGCGVATVLSKWGENPYVVRDGIDGILADTEDDWYRALKRLAEDSVYRTKLGAAGRERIKAEFSTAVFVRQLLLLIER